MKDITIRDLLEITKGHIIGKIDSDYRNELLGTKISRIAIDSRDVDSESLFVAIPGEKVDAHKFVPQVATVTKAILVEEDESTILAKADVDSMPENTAYIKVDNTLEALQKIGAYCRSKYTSKVVGVTGSVGKTTTREMISCALASNIPTFSTSGNMNSQIGVPITISKINDTPSEAAVIEMGISEPGGMDKLTQIVKPDIAVVTIIGKAHIEFLGSKEGIRDEKLRIIGRMSEDGAVFLNADDPMLFALKGKLPVKTFFYGTNPEADYRAENIVFENGYNTYTFVHGKDKLIVNLNVLGQHNVLNSLAALAVSDYMGLDLVKAARSFETFEGMRQKVISTDKGYTIIDDSYNASPDSMKAAINVLRDMDVIGKRIAVLGDMFELGPDGDNYHKEVGEYINTTKLPSGKPVIDMLITIGEASHYISDTVNSDVETKHFSDKKEAAEYIKTILGPGDVITFKASNGMKFAELVEMLK